MKCTKITATFRPYEGNQGCFMSEMFEDGSAGLDLVYEWDLVNPVHLHVCTTPQTGPSGPHTAWRPEGH